MSKETVGQRADAHAQEHGVNGTCFSFKLDGQVADRNAAATTIDDAQVVELVEVADEAAPATEASTT